MVSTGRQKSIVCPYCLDGTIIDSQCESCQETIRLRSGIPSVIAETSSERNEKKLLRLADVDSSSLDSVLSEIRADYMDGSVVDQFFKTRTVNWRMLSAPHLLGRGLVIGDHNEKVGIALSEILDEVHVVDTSVTSLRAQSAVANVSGTMVHPFHGNVEKLPYPPQSFDVVVVDCRAGAVTDYLTATKEFLTEQGTILLLVDGWPRESGLTEFIGLGESPTGVSDRVKSVITGHSLGLKRMVKKSEFSVQDQYALLSTARHENERGFNVESQTALDWLLHGSSKTATAAPFWIVRFLAQTGRELGALQQCYPRYLFVCKPGTNIGEVQTQKDILQDEILISGKNRTTVLEFDNGLKKVRKIPNSHRQSELNETACNVTASVTGSIAETVPEDDCIETVFGCERHEEPVSGTPLDQSLEATPESVNKHLRLVFNWLVEFQRVTTKQWVKRDPRTVTEELSVDCVGLTNPPVPDQTVEFPLIASHGDLFGSNIYIANEEVCHVIDWEWASMSNNPISDAGFFVLQLADYIGDDFEDGFEQLFFKQDYEDILRERINEYCYKTGLSYAVFKQYLSVGYIVRIRQDMKLNKRLDIDWVNRVQYIWNNYDRIRLKPDI